MLTSKQKALADAVAGVLASLVALGLTYPLDVHKTRLQADASSKRTRRTNDSPSPSSQSVLCYSGWKIKTLHTCSSSFCYFFLYGWMLGWYKKRRRDRNLTAEGTGTGVPSSAHLLLSAVAAALNTIVTLPLDVVASREQAGATPDTNDALCENKRNDGREGRENVSDGSSKPERWSGLWSGLVPSLLLCSNPAIHFTVYDALRDRILLNARRHRPGCYPSSFSSQQGKPQLSMPQAFALGVFAKLVATLITYPLIRAKVLLMVNHKAVPSSKTASESNLPLSPSTDSEHDDDEPSSTAEPSTYQKPGYAPPMLPSLSSSSPPSSTSSSLFGCLRSDYKLNGIVRGWYSGCSVQLCHTLLKSAITMMVKERTSRSTRSLLERVLLLLPRHAKPWSLASETLDPRSLPKPSTTALEPIKHR